MDSRLGRGMGPLISGKSRLVKYYSIWPKIFLKDFLFDEAMGSRLQRGLSASQWVVGQGSLNGTKIWGGSNKQQMFWLLNLDILKKTIQAWF